MLEPIASNLPFSIQKVSLLKTGVYKAEAEEASWVLKKIKKPISKMEFVWGIMNYLPAHGFSDLPVLQNLNGSDIPLVYQGDIYFACSFCAGERANFSKKNDLLAAFICLANFHAAARGFTFSGARISYFNKQAELQNMVDDLQAWGFAAKQTGGAFACLYRKLLPVYLQRAEAAFKLLEKAFYDEQAANAAAAKTFIHGDVAARNFIIHEGKAALIDFDYSRYDFHQADTARLLERSLGLWHYEEAVFNECLAAYRQSLYVSEAEIALLIALLSFPKRFWRLGKRYFADGITEKSLLKLKNLAKALPEENQLLWALQAKYV